MEQKVKISQLPEASTVGASDELILNQEGVTKKVTAENLQNSLSGGGTTGEWTQIKLTFAALTDGSAGASNVSEVSNYGSYLQYKVDGNHAILSLYGVPSVDVKSANVFTRIDSQVITLPFILKPTRPDATQIGGVALQNGNTTNGNYQDVYCAIDATTYPAGNDYRIQCCFKPNTTSVGLHFGVTVVFPIQTGTTTANELDEPILKNTSLDTLTVNN